MKHLRLLSRPPACAQGDDLSGKLELLASVLNVFASSKQVEPEPDPGPETLK